MNSNSGHAIAGKEPACTTNCKNAWIVSSAVIRGVSHIDTDIPCQDSVNFKVIGSWFVGVVSDGAGSALNSHFGSKLAVQVIVEVLEKEVAKRNSDNDMALMPDVISDAIAEARARLGDNLQKDETLEDYHCTVVGIVANEQGSVFFHVGDGLGIASTADIDKKQQTVDYWRKTQLSLPENGEYANETFFITQENWREHLRCIVISNPIDVIVLASDGPMALLLQSGKPNNGFIDVVLEHLGRTDAQDERDTYVDRILSASEVDAITSDDKSLLVATSPKVRGLRAHHPVPPPEKAEIESTARLSTISDTPSQLAPIQVPTLLQRINTTRLSFAVLLAILVGSLLVWLLMRGMHSPFTNHEEQISEAVNSPSSNSKFPAKKTPLANTIENIQLNSSTDSKPFGEEAIISGEDNSLHLTKTKIKLPAAGETRPVVPESE